jgi:hypothetical protein
MRAVLAQKKKQRDGREARDGPNRATVRVIRGPNRIVKVNIVVQSKPP